MTNKDFILDLVGYGGMLEPNPAKPAAWFFYDN